MQRAYRSGTVTAGERASDRAAELDCTFGHFGRRSHGGVTVFPVIAGHLSLDGTSYPWLGTTR